MKLNLGNARKYFSKTFKKERIDSPLDNHPESKQLGTFVYFLRLVSKDKDGADAISDTDPMWDSLLALKREAKLSVRQDPVVIPPYRSYTNEQLTRAESLLANYKELEPTKHNRIGALLVSIHKKQRKQRRRQRMIKYRKIESTDIAFITSFSSFLKDQPLAGYDGMEVKGLVAKILKRREKIWEVTPRLKVPDEEVIYEKVSSRAIEDLSERESSSWIKRVIRWWS